MSGFEIVGVLLGVIPILFESVDLSKEGIQRVRVGFRKRIYVRQLAHALLLQKQTLSETIKSLAIASGCGEVWRLDSDPLGYLDDEDTREQILDFLGHANTVALNCALDQSYETVKKIAGNIGGLVPALKGPSKDLQQIIRVNDEAKRRQFDVIPRVKLMFNVKDLKKAVEELDSTIGAIDRFARVLLSNRQVMNDTPSKKAAKLAKGLRQVRCSVNGLSVALSQGWKDCHSQHEVKLFLDERIDTLGRTLNLRNLKSAPSLVFQVILAARICEGQILLHEMAVNVLKDDADHDSKAPTISDLTAATSRVKIAGSTAKFLEKPDVIHVDDICGVIEESALMKRCPSFVLTGNRRIGMILDDEKPLLQCREADATTLEELLQPPDDKHPHDGNLLSLKLRMILALRVASNLLQLSHTHWLQSAWSKEAVYFLLEEGTGGTTGNCRVDFGRPFVPLKFEEKKYLAEPERNTEPKVALLELGILLLEIWHKMTLETRFSLKTAPVGYYKRLALAFEWLDDTSDPLPELYDNAVSRCVRGVVGGECRFSDWEDMEFWGAVCGDIIEPLSKNCKQWR